VRHFVHHIKRRDAQNLFGGAKTEQISTLVRMTKKGVDENICVYETLNGDSPGTSGSNGFLAVLHGARVCVCLILLVILSPELSRGVTAELTRIRIGRIADTLTQPTVAGNDPIEMNHSQSVKQVSCGAGHVLSGFYRLS
jgi:hypothetical protein